MAGGLPIMRAYRPSSTQEALRSVPILTTTVFHPAPVDTDSQRAAWIQESRIWSRILAQTIEHRKQHQLDVQKVQAKHDTQTADLVHYKLTWLMSCAGLVLSGFLFLILFLILNTDIFRDSKGVQLGTSTACDVVPSLTDGSEFSVLYWTAVVLYLSLRLVASAAATNVAALSEGLGRADAAYYRCQSEYCIIVNRACTIVATEGLAYGFVLMVRGSCDGGTCPKLAVATSAIMCWSSLVSIFGILFFESGRIVVGQWKRLARMLSWEKGLREVAGKRVWELLRQDERDAFEWV
ncbi:MAG: hypothetical protein Q9161_002065 [Pseudevernia consocians]